MQEVFHVNTDPGRRALYGYPQCHGKNNHGIYLKNSGMSFVKSPCFREIWWIVPAFYESISKNRNELWWYNHELDFPITSFQVLPLSLLSNRPTKTSIVWLSNVPLQQPWNLPKQVRDAVCKVILSGRDLVECVLFCFSCVLF